MNWLRSSIGNKKLGSTDGEGFLFFVFFFSWKERKELIFLQLPQGELLCQWYECESIQMIGNRDSERFSHIRIDTADSKAGM